MAGIGKMTKHDGYFEGEGYIVTWAFGHLFSLADVEEYSDSKEERRQLRNSRSRFEVYWNARHTSHLPRVQHHAGRRRRT